MGPAILEGLFLLAILIGIVVGGFAILVRYTEFGQWAMRRFHKFSIDTNRRYECPVGHGVFGPAEVVEIDGIGLCPKCYQDQGVKQRLWRIKKKTTPARF